MAETLPVHTLVALNTATSSENKIHDDDVAAALGFGGGLVPGVDVYAYLCQPAVARWGLDFLTRGRATARFGSPVYDGERVEVEAELDDDGRLTARVRRPDRSVAATLQARIDAEPPTAPEVGTAQRPDPAERRPASPESIPVGTVLGTFDFRCTAGEHAAYLASVRDERSPVAELGLVHPGSLLRLANTVLSQTVLLGPWIHVGSEVHNYAPVAVDEEISVRGIVTGNYEHKGHRFVDLDAVLVGPDGSVRTWVEHKAIYEPRQVRQLQAS
jgi:acyl dehydratase